MLIASHSGCAAYISNGSILVRYIIVCLQRKKLEIENLLSMQYFFLSPQESHKRVSGFSAAWIPLSSVQGVPAESVARRPGITLSCKLYFLDHSEMPDCFMSIKLWHNLLLLFINVIKDFHKAPHSVSAVPTTVFCILHPRMDSGKCKQSKQANKKLLLSSGLFFSIEHECHLLFKQNWKQHCH